MSAGTLVSIHEYLTTSYRPDCDYVDGVIVERNVGEFDHSSLRMAIAAYFYARKKEWEITVVPEQRVQVSPTRFRVPDICVTLGRPQEQIFRTPPFICIESLSPEDRLVAMQEKVGDFLRMGVPYVWILDPKTRRAWRCTVEGMNQVSELRTENPSLTVPLEAVFES